MVWEVAEWRLDNAEAETGGETALAIANQLQIEIIETITNTWPTCPEHGLHPLWIDELDLGAMWTCQQNAQAWARLGELSGLRRT
jgi:hypothetical protein